LVSFRADDFLMVLMDSVETSALNPGKSTSSGGQKKVQE